MSKSYRLCTSCIYEDSCAFIEDYERNVEKLQKRKVVWAPIGSLCEKFFPKCAGCLFGVNPEKNDLA